MPGIGFTQLNDGSDGAYGMVLSYGGIVFNITAVTSVKAEPVADQSGRITKYVRHHLSIKAFVTAPTVLGIPTTTDAQLTTMRQTLSRRGLALSYYRKGYGNLIVNQTGPGTVQDVDWGPVPKLITFRPIGPGVTAAIEWEVTTTIPECPTAPSSGRFAALSYSTEWTADNADYLRLVTTGEVELAMG